MKILAGIVLYNPDIDRLSENIKSISSQVEKLVLIDNGCSDTGYTLLVSNNSEIIINNKNLGIATALNQILQYALDHDYDWALTLDQDSVSSPDLIKTYCDVIQKLNDDKLGMICCKINDRNATLQREEDVIKTDAYIDKCITSASMVNVKAWQNICGFDDVMFIDSVDFDFCITLQKYGWKIYRTIQTQILHEVGHSKIVKFFGKEYLSLNHSPFRYYYIVRNCIYEGRKHGFLLSNLFVTARVFFTVFRYEKQKKEKLSRMLIGLYHGFTMRISKPKKRLKSKLVS